MTWEHYQQDGTLKVAGDGVPPAGVVCQATIAAGFTPSAGVDTKVALDTKVFDPYAWFDTTNNRFLPKIAGYYDVNVRAGFQVATGAGGYVLAYIYKNGANVGRVGEQDHVNTGAFNVVDGSQLVYLNGTTDYIELWINAQQAIGVLGTSLYTMLDAHLVGAAVGALPGSYVPGTGTPAGAALVPVADGLGGYTWTTVAAAGVATGAVTRAKLSTSLIQTGTSTFNGATNVTVTFAQAMADANYRVFLTATQQTIPTPGFSIVSKATASFVCVSSIGNTDTFDYMAIHD